jgi:ferric-dicitrate binding protein FerR (iron transport regulator)
MRTANHIAPPHTLMTTEQDEKLRRLVSRLLDGDLTPGQHKELEHVLKSDPSARKTYLNCLAIETQLHWQHWKSSNHNAALETRDNVIQGPWTRARKMLAGAAAAAVAAGAWVTTNPGKKVIQPETPATVAEDSTPILTETVHENGKTTAYLYFRMDDSGDFPES